MKYIAYIILLCSICSNAQKTIEKNITLNSNVSTVIFDLEHVFSIHLKSNKGNDIIVKAKSEGEYANHFLITEKTDGNTVIISGKIGFTFPNIQDKLSAHKVHAVTVEINVPQHLQILINSAIGNLNATGFYKELIVNFMSGNCVLTNTSGKLNIHTVNGDINLITENGEVIAESKKGHITQKRLSKGTSIFELKTIKGNINIEQSK